MKSLIKIMICAFVCSSFFISEFSVASTRSGERFKKVVWVIFENENYENVFKAPEFANLAKLGVSLKNMHGEIHPSQGNYIAMIAGSAFGIDTDRNVNLNENHVGDLLEQAGMDWKVYAEDYPGNCYKKETYKEYVRKHVPFLSFTNVTKNPERCAKIVSSDEFRSDYEKKVLPEFSMYVPNLLNDGHDTSIYHSGKWLWNNFSDILSDPDQLDDVLFIITYDESGFFSWNNQIYTVLLGKNIKANTTNDQKLNHISLLKMIEDEFDIGNLGREDASANSPKGIWK